MSMLFSGTASPGLLVHEWTSLRQLPAAPAAASAALTPPGDATQALRGPAPLPLHSLAVAAAERRTSRAYADAALSSAELWSLLRTASAATWAGPQRVLLLPLVLRVATLTAGAYGYASGQDELWPVRMDDPGPLLERFCYQAEFSSAPVVVLLVGAPGAALEPGDRGYRSLLLELGWRAQLLYLATSALGLAGALFGSLIQPPLNRWLGFDGYSATVLTGFAVGRMAGRTA